jgi:putative redox protein
MKMKDTLHANGTLGAENYLMEIKTTKHTVTKKKQ